MHPPHELSKKKSTAHSHREPELRIMIVDDDVDLLRAMVPLVAGWGLSVVSFDKFEAARAELMAGIEADALLVDVRIGSFNGLQLVYLARHLRPAMTVVVMSGFDDPVIRTDTEKAGARFLLKPVHADVLQQMLFRESR
jgi:FixJ family two-component response regulator